MKLKKLIKKLQELESLHGNLDVIVDQDENGHYEVTKAEFVMDEGNDFINIKSTNES